jgi:hypothetical protein
MPRQTREVSGRASVPTDVWIDGRLGVGGSAIDGCGLFFENAFAADTIVIRLGGRLVSSDELAALMQSAGGR